MTEFQAATKQDIAALIAKLDFSQFATKQDLDELKAELKDDNKRIAMYVLQMDASVKRRLERIEADNGRFRSRLLSIAEDFGIKHLKTDRGQVLLGDRVDLLEKRVEVLESERQPPDRDPA